jgi:hypothetical protein
MTKFEQGLAMTILHANRHTLSGSLSEPPPSNLSSSQARRAEDGIKANWQGGSADAACFGRDYAAAFGESPTQMTLQGSIELMPPGT